MPTDPLTYFIIFHDPIMGIPPRFEPALKHSGADLHLAMLRLNDLPSISWKSRDDCWYTLYEMPAGKFNPESICANFTRSACPVPDTGIKAIAIRSGEKSCFFEPALDRQYKLLLDATPGYPAVRNYSNSEIKGIRQYYRVPTPKKILPPTDQTAQKVERLPMPVVSRVNTGHGQTPKSRRH